MRWPLVLRSTFDGALADAKEARQTGYQQYIYERSRREDLQKSFDALLEKYHALRLQGQTATPARPDIAPAAFDPIEDAITEKAGNNGGLRRHLTRIADKMRSANKPSEEIIKAVTQWRDPDSEEAA